MHMFVFGWVVWVATGIFTVVPIFTSSYGHAGVWCWIKRGGVSTVFRFATFYIPLYICIGLMIYMYFKIIGTVKRTMQGQTDLEERDKRRAARAMDRLRLYPVIFIALYICPTINRVVNWATNDEVCHRHTYKSAHINRLTSCSADSISYCTWLKL
jgi:hypothetical protein